MAKRFLKFLILFFSFFLSSISAHTFCLQFAQNPQNSQAAAILQNPDAYSPDQRAQALQTFNDYASAQFGVKAPAATAVYNGDALQGSKADLAINAETRKTELKSELSGAYDTKNNKIMINDANQDGSTQTLVQTDGHELKHSLDDQLGKKATEAGAERFGNQATNALSDEIGQGAGVNSNHSNFVDFNQQAGRYEVGNQVAAEAQEVDPRFSLKLGKKP